MFWQSFTYTFGLLGQGFAVGGYGALNAALQLRETTSKPPQRLPIPLSIYTPVAG